MSLINTFINEPEKIQESINKIRKAGEPEIFDKSYLITIGFESSGAVLYRRLFVMMGLVNEDGSLTPDFSRFLSSEEEARTVFSEKIWEGYTQVFVIEKNALHENTDQLMEVFRKIHGDETSDSYIHLLASTFKALAEFAESKPKKTGAVTNGVKNGNYTNGHANGETNSEEADFLEDLMNNVSEHRYNFKACESQKQETAAVAEEPGQEMETLPPPSEIKETAPEEKPKVSQATPMIEKRAGKIDNNMLTKALMKRAELLQMLERYEEAETAFDQMIDFFEKSDTPERDVVLPDMLMRKAEICEKNKHFEKALMAYEDVMNRYYPTTR